MAEQQTIEAGAVTGATPPEATPEPQATQSPLSEEVVREAIREENSRMWAAVRQQLGPLQAQAATVQQLAQAHQALTGDVQQTRVLVERLLEAGSSPEEVQGILQAEKARQEAVALRS